ncbi:hypothetical protein BaRGS_00025797 [Batillaria attramentaria]|uniref:Uncharacterized protein n=1 Tax=Batillaria attramentaria TaxID=370345 RepID=A0ABD0K7J2_9CAEN
MTKPWPFQTHTETENYTHNTTESSGLIGRHCSPELHTTEPPACLFIHTYWPCCPKPPPAFSLLSWLTGTALTALSSSSSNTQPPVEGLMRQQVIHHSKNFSALFLPAVSVSR